MLDAGDTKDYEQTLNKQWGDVPKDVILPAGSYRLKCLKVKNDKPNEVIDTEKVLFMYSVVEPCDDVDMKAFGAIAPKDIQALVLMKDFWLRGGRDYRALTAHMVKHGVDLSKTTKRDECYPLLPGSELIAFIEPENYVSKKTGEAGTSNRLREFAPKP